MSNVEKNTLTEFVKMLAKLDPQQRSKLLEGLRQFDRYNDLKNLTSSQLEQVISKRGTGMSFGGM